PSSARRATRSDRVDMRCGPVMWASRSTCGIAWRRSRTFLPLTCFETEGLIRSRTQTVIHASEKGRAANLMPKRCRDRGCSRSAARAQRACGRRRSRHGAGYPDAVAVGRERAFWVRAIPCSAVAQQRHKIIRKRLALLGDESVSVVTVGTGPTQSGDPVCPASRFGRYLLGRLVLRRHSIAPQGSEERYCRAWWRKSSSPRTRLPSECVDFICWAGISRHP